MWVKLDEHFPEHPKTVAVGPLASWLYVAGLCYANRLQTDGFIPKVQVHHLLHANGTKPDQLVAKLLAVGLWGPQKRNGQPGYQIHDYLAYQPSRKSIEQARRKTAKRQAKWRKEQARKRNAKRDA
jgi:hypothetical protein